MIYPPTAFVGAEWEYPPGFITPGIIKKQAFVFDLFLNH
jgi:hypothetical protein